EYLLGLEGFAASTPEAAGQIPAALLEEVFALNEQLDEVRGLRASGAPRDQLTQRLDRARERIEQKRADHERHVEQLCAQWDAFVDARAGQESRREILEALRDRMLERNYINNLLAAIERELLADA